MGNEDWMTSLPDQVRNISVINLAIPGTHNSMTYGIKAGALIAPDAEPAARRLNWIFPCMVRRWARTQSATVLEQLQLGVRYFDLRVCQVDDKFYYTHGLLCMEVMEPLEQLIRFLDAHVGEVVVLDFQHFYDMKVMHHMELHKQLVALFQARFYHSADGELNECTLNRCRELGRQVVLIYRRCPLNLPKEFWPSFAWPTPWPNTASSKKLQDFLQNSLLTRRPTQGYVSQCVITPTGRYIALRCFSSLRKTAKKVDKKLHPWIICQSPGPFATKEPPRVNVFIADFVNLKDGQFCNWVISLNTKLCDATADSFEKQPETEG